MISFKNKGLIDIRAVTTFGVSVKEKANPIGYFGTGMKYAIAVILRQGGEITLWCGLRRYDFGLEDAEIRGAPFRIVTMTEFGEEGDHPQTMRLGFTTELGKNWQMWMAFRELWCNTQDEQEPMISDAALVPNKHCTLVEVKRCHEFDLCYARRDEVILATRPIVTSGVAEAHPGETLKIFYRGIRIYDQRQPWKFTYNLLDTTELTEDRTLKYFFRAKYAISSLVLACTNRAWLKEWLTVPKGYAEHDFDLAEYGMTPGETFLSVVGDLRATKFDLGVNLSACKIHRDHVRKNVLPSDSIELNKVEREQFRRARDFVHETLECDMELYPITVLADLGTGHLGRADLEEKKIYIARKAFEMGTKWLAMALFEEWVHINQQVYDETHEQKIFYLEKIMSLGERMRGCPL